MAELVKDIMKSPVVSVEPVISAKEAAAMMERENVGCIVISEKNNPLGILTERDFVRKIIARGKDFSIPVEEIMSSPVKTIEPDKSIFELIQMMKQNGVHRIPVAKDGLRGIVTITDVVNSAQLDTKNVDFNKLLQEALLRISPTKSLTSK